MARYISLCSPVFRWVTADECCSVNTDSETAWCQSGWWHLQHATISKKKKKRIWEMCAFSVLRPTCTCPLRPGNHTTCETQHWGSQWRTTIPSSVGNSSAVHMTEMFQSLTVTWTLKIAIQSFHMTFKFTKQYGCKWFSGSDIACVWDSCGCFLYFNFKKSLEPHCGLDLMDSDPKFLRATQVLCWLMYHPTNLGCKKLNSS